MQPTKPGEVERSGPTLTPNMNSKRFKADTQQYTEHSHGWEGKGERERSGYQAKSSQDCRAESRAKYKPPAPINKPQRVHEDQYRTDKNNRSVSGQSYHASKQDHSANKQGRHNYNYEPKKSSSSHKASKQIAPDYNYELYSGEDRSNKQIPASKPNSHAWFDKSCGYSKSDDKSNREYATRNAEKHKAKSHLTVSKILASVSTVPTVPPKIILKRKEIQVSPAPAITESPTSVPRFHNAQPTETDDFDMISESEGLPAIGDETSTEISTSPTPPASSITAVEPQTRREPAGELMEDGDKQVRIPARPDLASKDTREELLILDEPRSEPTETMNLQVPTQPIANSSIQESSLKSEDSMDYEFIFHYI